MVRMKPVYLLSSEFLFCDIESCHLIDRQDLLEFL